MALLTIFGAMGTHRGTHGTSVQRADGIETNGFDPTLVGKAGSGVYLWAYAGDVSTARELALGWYGNQQIRGVFAGETEPKWAILYAEIDVAADDCCDCNTLEFRELLVAWLRGLGRREDEPYSDDDLCKAYNALIGRIEAKVEHEFCVVHACVPFPKKMAFKERVAVNDAFIHLVRRKYDRLRIIRRESEPPDEVEAQEFAAIGR